MSTSRSLTAKTFIHADVPSTNLEVLYKYSDPNLGRTTQSNSLVNNICVHETTNSRNNFEFANQRLTAGWNDDNIEEFSAIPDILNIMSTRSELNFQNHHQSRSEFETNIEGDKNKKSFCKLKSNLISVSVIELST